MTAPVAGAAADGSGSTRIRSGQALPTEAQHAGGQPMVRLRGVSKSYGGNRVVDDVSFDLAPGRFLTILGPSGSGKSTVLRMIAGFIAPDGGEIEIHGRPVGAVPPYRRSIGMVFQRLALFPHMTAAENVAYPLKMRRHDPRTIPERVERYLELVQLGGFGGRRIHELSGGQQQRVAIARALVFEPDLLLLDEPLAALDRKLREDMQLEFRRIQQELAVTTINVTHDQREALVMSDQVIVMDHGRVQQAAPPAAIYGVPANRFVAGFIGVTNFLSGRLERAGEGEAVVRIGSILLRGRTALGPDAAGRPVEAAIRAERLSLAPSPAGGADEAGSEPGPAILLHGTVAEAIFEGDRIVYGVDCPALAAMLRVFDTAGTATPLPAGTAVAIGWRSEDLMVFPA